MNYNFNSQNKLSASSGKEYFMNSSGTWKVGVCLHVSLSVACVADVKGEGEGGIWARQSARGRKERNACKEAIVSLQVFLPYLPRRASKFPLPLPLLTPAK